jgi:D-amino-acid dehydrogenase
MFQPQSPFYINPRLDPDLLRWVWRFYRSCKSSHVQRSAGVLRDFHLLSKSLYQELNSVSGFDFDFQERGSLMLYRTQNGRHEELTNAESAQKMGLQVSELSASDVETAMGGMRCDVLGGFLYHDDAHLYPGKFVLELQSKLKAAGVRFITGKAVVGFNTTGSELTHVLLGDGTSIQVQNVVLACGAWSGILTKKLGLNLLMQDGKGYSVTFKNQIPQYPLPSILTEARVAVTPMGADLRIGGTLEVSNFSPGIRQKRVAGILRAMHEYYPDFPDLDVSDVDVWHGFRPVSADGLPYIGRPRAYNNLIVATGHAMLGMSLGPATGLLVSEIAQGIRPGLSLEIFNPDRF